MRQEERELIIKGLEGEKYEGELPSDMIVKLHNTVTVAEANIENGMPAKDPIEAPKTITCKKMSATEFNAIVVPPNIPSIRQFIEVITMGVSYLVESTFIFRPGVQYTASQGKILINIGGQIDNTWE